MAIVPGWMEDEETVSQKDGLVLALDWARLFRYYINKYPYK